MGDASIWDTRFNSLHPSEDTLAKEERYVGIKIGEAYCVSGYCSPNVSLNISDEYQEKHTHRGSHEEI